jgi:hypothetical protein
MLGKGQCKICDKKFVKSTQNVWHLNGNSYSRFKLFKLYSNMLKWVNLIEIRFYAYLYASSFLVLWDYCADTGSWIRGQIRILVINCHIARQDFILNDLFSGRRNPGKILKFTSQTFSTSVEMTSQKHKQKVAQKFNKCKQNAIWGQIRIFAPYLPWGQITNTDF